GCLRSGAVVAIKRFSVRLAPAGYAQVGTKFGTKFLSSPTTVSLPQTPAAAAVPSSKRGAWARSSQNGASSRDGPAPRIFERGPRVAPIGLDSLRLSWRNAASPLAGSSQFRPLSVGTCCRLVAPSRQSSPHGSASLRPSRPPLELLAFADTSGGRPHLNCAAH